MRGKRPDPCQDILHRQLGKVYQLKPPGIGSETVAEDLLAISVVGRLSPLSGRHALCRVSSEGQSSNTPAMLSPMTTPVIKLRDGELFQALGVGSGHLTGDNGHPGEQPC